MSLKEQITERFNQFQNPLTSKSFLEENRLLSCQEKLSEFVIEYSREGISVEHKRSIEKDISASLKELTDKDVILISKSDNSSDVWKEIGKDAPQKAKNPASLKVGHGQAGEKKRIPGVKNVICIASGKGGVGKSSFTVNLASTLMNQGRKVGIVDADIYGPSVPMLMGERETQPESNDDKKILPILSKGLKYISFGNFIDESEPVVWRGPMLGGVLNQFFFDTMWGELDYLLIDLPPGTGDVQLSMIQNVVIDGAIVISTPQDVAMLDAQKGLNMFLKLKVPVLGMVENMSSFICDSCDKEHFIFGTQGVFNFCNRTGVGYLGSIPFDMNLRKSTDFGEPYMLNDRNKDSKIWDSYESVKERIDKYFFPKLDKKPFLSKIFQKEN